MDGASAETIIGMFLEAVDDVGVAVCEMRGSVCVDRSWCHGTWSLSVE